MRSNMPSYSLSSFLAFHLQPHPLVELLRQIANQARKLRENMTHRFLHASLHYGLSQIRRNHVEAACKQRKSGVYTVRLPLSGCASKRLANQIHHLVQQIDIDAQV
ncbi:MAG: hypothetical protein WBX22_15295 [Silvibacterium sp.]